MELERMIDIYQTAFIICLVLGILSLAAAVFLFFKFDIRTIYNIRTGRDKKRAIAKMEEINAMTGKLRQETVASTPVHLRSEERVVSPETPQVLQKQEEPIRQEQPSTSEGTQATTLLQEELPETTVLFATSPDAGQQDSAPTKRELPGAFKIEKEVIWIHTKEIL